MQEIPLKNSNFFSFLTSIFVRFLTIDDILGKFSEEPNDDFVVHVN